MVMLFHFYSIAMYPFTISEAKQNIFSFPTKGKGSYLPAGASGAKKIIYLKTCP